MIHEIVEQQATLNHQNLAIDAGRKTTYEQLALETRELAALLRTNGVGQDTIVVAALPLSTVLIVSMLSIFKANGVYLPVDLVRFSPRRLNQVFTEAFHGYLITEETQLEAVKNLLRQADIRECRLFLPREGAPYKILQYHSATESFQEVAPPVLQSITRQVSGDDSCYIYYTSGSTGDGKAILGRHASLEHYITWAIREFGIGPADKIAHLSQTTFDASLKDSLMALCSGATLMLPPPAKKENMNSLCRWIDKSHVSLFQTVPSLFRLMIRSLASMAAKDRLLFKALRTIFLDGEPLLAKDVSEWRKYGNDQTELVNMYGTTETTILDTFHRIATIPEDPGQVIHVGKPIDKTFIIILNQREQLCRIGTIGEVYIKSAYLTKGYYNNEALTRESFVQNPLVSGKKDIIYKTGDLGRYLPDRSVEILGRKDRQLKINGVRVELGEIERAVLRTGLANEVLIKDIKSANQQTHLICYYTTSGEVVPLELRKALQQELNQTLTPSFFIRLEQFPVNINGKVDKHALPLPADIVDAINYEPVQGPIEEQLERVWKDVLELDCIGRKASFFNLGGHSLKAMQLITRIQQDLGVEVKMEDIFAHPTIEGLTAHLSRSKAIGYSGIPKLERQAHHPLSFSQQRLWFIHQQEGERGLTYNIPAAIRIRGTINMEFLHESLNLLADRHECLRTSFHLVDGRPVQDIHDSLPYKVMVLRPGQVYAEDELHEIIRREAGEPFDLDKPPLMRLTLIEQDHELVLILLMHHIITDHWSMNILIREFFTVYQNLSEGIAPQLSPLPIRYTDFVHWQRYQVESGAWESQFLYWKKELEGMRPLLRLPLRQRRPRVQTYNGSMERFTVDAEWARRLKEFCEEEKCTLFMALMAAFASLLAKYSGQSEVVIGYPVANRHRKELEPLVGFFANTLVMCLEMDRLLSFRQLLQKIRLKTFEATNNQDYPFDKLVERLNPKRNLSYAPVFQVMLSVQHDQQPEVPPGFSLTPLRLTQTAGAKFDLNLIAEASTEQLSLAFEYNTDLFDAAMVQRMIMHLKVVFETMLVRPEQSLGRLSILTANEERLFSSWNNTQWPDHPSRFVHELFECRVKEHPHRLALATEMEELTYDELYRRADRLASYLKNQGLRTGVLIGLCLERSAAAVVALLGILKAGGAYLPLDPRQPAARLQYLLKDSDVQLVLTEEKWIRKLSNLLWYGRDQLLFAMDADWPVLDLSALRKQPASRDDGQPAGVLYTSGSAGKPRGVINEHASLLNRLRWMQEVFPLSGDDRLLHKSPFPTDAAVWEMLWPLTAGGQLVIAPWWEQEDGRQLVEIVERFGITTIHFTPSLLEMFLASLGEGSCRSLQRVFCSGEALTRPLQTRFFEKIDGELINLYGLAEASIVSGWRCSPERQEDPAPIGRPISNLQVCILDAEGIPVPIGVTGTLHIGGTGVASTCISKAEPAAEESIPHPWKENELLYATEDLGCFAPDGIIEYRGRAEHQVKLQGLTIELLEIETVLLSHPRLRHAAVLSNVDQQMRPSLAAFYSTVDKKSVPTSELKAFLLEYVPEFMVPDRFRFLEEWPLTLEGKTDRSALNSRDGWLDMNHEPPAYAAPGTLTEVELAKLWSALLPVERPGIDDDFFDLGGHSLLGMELIAKIQERFGLKLSVTEFFDQNTIRKVALTIDKISQLRMEMEGDLLEEEGGQITKI